jgi:hypothetical protein
LNGGILSDKAVVEAVDAASANSTTLKAVLNANPQ